MVQTLNMRKSTIGSYSQELVFVKLRKPVKWDAKGVVCLNNGISKPKKILFEGNSRRLGTWRRDIPDYLLEEESNCILYAIEYSQGIVLNNNLLNQL